MHTLLVGGCANLATRPIDPTGETICFCDDSYAYGPPEPVFCQVAVPMTPVSTLPPCPPCPLYEDSLEETGCCRGLLDGSLIDRFCRWGWDDPQVSTPPAECAEHVPYGWEPHPLLLQSPAPITGPVTPGQRPTQLVAPPQPLLPYGYDAGYDTPYNTNALTSTGGDPRNGYNGRLTINPRRLVAPVGQTVVLQGAICGEDGYYLKDQPIEWSISPDSVGTIVEVDRTDQGLFDRWFGRAPIKKSGSYALGRTSLGAQVLPRDVANPTDDVYLKSGQTWISISSASEGSTHVTAVAPTVTGWEQRQQKATIHWVDGRWQFPAPAISSYGGGHTLTTRVVRASDGAPVENWLVRYEIVGGAPAAFDTGGAQAIEVSTGSHGEASATAVPQGEFSGTTQVNIRVIRRGRTPGDLPRLPVGQGSTSITWSGSAPTSAPFVPVTPTPPMSPPEPTVAPILTTRVSGVSVAEVGATATYQFRVENVGNGAADNVTVSSTVPPGLRYETSSPQAGEFGDTLRWELGPLDPGMARSVTVTYHVDRDEPIELCATASAAAAQDATDCVTTNVRSNQPNLDVQIRGDQTANVGQQVHYDLFINNISDRPLTNVQIVVEFDEGLVHAAGKSPVDRTFGTIEPRQAITQPLNFTVRTEGRRCFRVITTTAEGARDEREQCVEVAPASTSTIVPQPSPQTRPLQAPPLQTQPLQTQPLQTQPLQSQPLQSQPLQTQPLRTPPAEFDLPPTPGGSSTTNRGWREPRQALSASDTAEPAPNDLELRVRRMGPDPGNPKQLLIYIVEVANIGESSHRDVALSIQTPSGTRFQSSIDPPGVNPTRKSPDERQVDYQPIGELRGGERVSFQITVARQEDEIGDLLARATSDLQLMPVREDDRQR
jgi:uncharacterized repeat protein (TIGR01451 family)